MWAGGNHSDEDANNGVVRLWLVTYKLIEDLPATKVEISDRDIHAIKSAKCELQLVTQALIDDGAVWMSGSRWAGRDVLRISVSNWSTDAADVAVSVDAVARALAKTGQRPKSE